MNVTVYDNGGETFDRYTVILREYGYALGIGDTGNVPNGFCMSLAPDEYVEGPHLGRVISVEDMTPAARKAVEDELRFAERETAALALERLARWRLGPDESIQHTQRGRRESTKRGSADKRTRGENER